MQDIRKNNMFDINTLTCYVCNYNGTNKSNFKNHIYSMKHHKNVEKLNENEPNEQEEDADHYTPSYTATFSEINPPSTPIKDKEDVEPSKLTRTRKRTTKKTQNTNLDNTHFTDDRHHEIPPGYIQQEDLVDEIVNLSTLTLHDYDDREKASNTNIVSAGCLMVAAFYFIYTYIK